METLSVDSERVSTLICSNKKSSAASYSSFDSFTRVSESFTTFEIAVWNLSLAK